MNTNRLKAVSLILLCLGIFSASHYLRFSFSQSVSLTIFSTSVLAMLLFWYRDEIKKLDVKIKEIGQDKELLKKLICVPLTRDIMDELLVFLVTFFTIGMHHRLEYAFHFPKNSLLLSIPLISAGTIMLWRREKAREYIEKDVDW